MLKLVTAQRLRRGQDNEQKIALIGRFGVLRALRPLSGALAGREPGSAVASRPEMISLRCCGFPLAFEESECSRFGPGVRVIDSRSSDRDGAGG
ncbi:hypothetical protein GCM10027271_41290 [Saccharopolyspora gloriosae]